VRTAFSRLADGHFDLTFVLVTGLYAVVIVVAVITTLSSITTLDGIATGLWAR
jgi:hypothetical protein